MLLSHELGEIRDGRGRSMSVPPSTSLLTAEKRPGIEKTFVFLSSFVTSRGLI